MSLFVRYLKRALVMLALLAAVVIVAGAIYVRTASFGRLLKTQASNLLATSFRGEITLSEIDTSIWGALTIHELSIKIWRRGSRPDSPNPAQLFINSVVVARSAN
jgi:autotransporter translocation and assembly factor TamB